MPNFKVGDEVMCIDTISTTHVPLSRYLKAGQKYTVAGLSETSCCGNAVIRLAGTDDGRGNKCPNCHHIFSITHSWFSTWRFVKLDGLSEPENEVESTNLPTLAEKV